MDFLRTLNRPVFEDAITTRRGVALRGRLIGATALEGTRDDTCEGTKRVHRGQTKGITKFPGNSDSQSEADPRDAREHCVRGGGEQDGGLLAQLVGVVERATDPRKVLCVALDYAKHKHMALCCDGNGDILRKPFAVDNTAEGVAFLIEKISATARRRKTSKCNIFLGGEDEPSYVANFTAALRSRQYLVLRVNTADPISPSLK